MFSLFNDFFGAAHIKNRQRQLESGGAHRLSLSVLVIVGLLGYKGFPYPGVLTMIMLGVTVYEFVKRMDQGVPLMQVAAVLAVLQWNVGAWLTYNLDYFYSTYVMRVDSITYFTYSIPGTAAFVVGLLSVGVGPRQRRLLRNADRSQFAEIGMILAMIGFASGLAMKVLPGGLIFVFYLASQLRYVAAIYFLLSKSPLRYGFAAVSLLPLFIGSAESAMFHDVMLWVGLVGCYWYAQKKRRLWVTLLVLIFGFAVGFTIQGIKKSYRDKVWNDEEASMSEEVRNFWANRHAMLGEENLSNAIIRINQGWIIAAIMQNVPSQEPYAKGDTIGEAVSAALIPRIAVEEKAKSGGQVNFRRFTGLPIADTTSMGLSLLGEAYANIGPDWGIVLMLMFGAGMALAYGGCLRWAVTHPTFYFWIPVIFCQTIKAETDLVTILNQITKGSIVVFGLYWLICIKLLPAAMVAKRGRRKHAKSSGNEVLNRSRRQAHESKLARQAALSNPADPRG